MGPNAVPVVYGNQLMYALMKRHSRLYWLPPSLLHQNQVPPPHGTVAFGVAPNTVEAQLSSLYRKHDVHNRAQALAAARAHGLIPDGP
jgi:hypothetical protein